MGGRRGSERNKKVDILKRRVEVVEEGGKERKEGRGMRGPGKEEAEG